MKAPRWKSLYTRNLSRRDCKVDLIVLHHTGGTEAGDIPTLLGLTRRRVSADFYVTREGVIYKLNPQLTVYYTWHAGVSRWSKRWNVNKFSVGIEQEHIAGQDWPDKQVSATAELCAWLLERFGLAPECIVSHRDVAWPRGRKNDPEHFPWPRFRARLNEIASASN